MTKPIKIYQYLNNPRVSFFMCILFYEKGIF